MLVKWASETCTSFCVLGIKSTVLPGTTRTLLQERIKGSKSLSSRVGVVFNPEFLSEGQAVAKAKNPDRIVIGTQNQKAADLLMNMYEESLGKAACVFIKMTMESAELTKYASNCFLATKISFANEIANLAERIPGADIEEVIRGVGLDHRIEQKFLGAGVGYGGSCLPKDIQSLVHFAEDLDIDLRIPKATHDINLERPKKFVDMVLEHLESIDSKKVTILGLAFKPGTDDIRESPAVGIAHILLELGAEIWIHDPIVSVMKIPSELEKKAHISDDLEVCLRDSHACILATEWPLYKDTSLQGLTRLMSTKLIIDGRRVFHNSTIPSGIIYRTVGRVDS
jgi:UDPglucose 6-dehydrogenase